MRRINVAIIGAGNVGSTLGGALLRHEHEHFHVKYGVRQPSADKYHRLLNKQPGASLADVHTACSWGHVIILATPGSTEDSDIQGLASSLGDGVNGKVVIDATNPVSK
jgi:predicted dinucleotide-binding enzyme